MLQFAIVGCGSMAHWHAQQLAKIPGVKVVALIDPDAQQAHKLKEKYFPQAMVFTDYGRFIRHPPMKLDAAVFVTPHTLHYPQAKAALEGGLHVLLEKPMVTSSADAFDLWRTVKKTGKLLGITFQAPYTDAFKYIASQRDAGELGKIQIISGWLSQAWLQSTGKTWRQDPSLSGGGQMYDSGAHLLNAIMWLVNDPVVEVGCFYNNCSSPVDINGVAIARFHNGAMASIAIGGNCPPFRTEIQIQTDSRLIVTDQYGAKLEMMGPDNKTIAPPAKAEALVAATDQAQGTPHANFVNAIHGTEPLRVPVRYGVLLSALMDAMYESGTSGTIVKVSPVPLDVV